MSQKSHLKDLSIFTTKVEKNRKQKLSSERNIALIQAGLNGVSVNALNICSGLNFDKGHSSLT